MKSKSSASDKMIEKMHAIEQKLSAIEAALADPKKKPPVQGGNPKPANPLHHYPEYIQPSFHQEFPENAYPTEPKHHVSRPGSWLDRISIDSIINIINDPKMKQIMDTLLKSSTGKSSAPRVKRKNKSAR